MGLLVCCLGVLTRFIRNLACFSFGSRLDFPRCFPSIPEGILSLALGFIQFLFGFGQNSACLLLCGCLRGLSLVFGVSKYRFSLAFSRSDFLLCSKIRPPLGFGDNSVCLCPCLLLLLLSRFEDFLSFLLCQVDFLPRFLLCSPLSFGNNFIDAELGFFLCLFPCFIDYPFSLFLSGCYDCICFRLCLLRYFLGLLFRVSDSL